MTEETARQGTREGIFAVFATPGFANVWTALLLTGFAVQIQTVAVGWRIYDMTRDPFDLGLVGLSQFLPALMLVLVTGVVSDRFPRRAIMAVCLTVMAALAGGLLSLVRAGSTEVLPVFVLIALFGATRAFYNPARQSIVANLVPGEHLSKAITLNTNASQIATICGPVAGGLLYGVNPEAAFAAPILLFAGAALSMLRVPRPAVRTRPPHPTWDSLIAGFRYIWDSKVVLGVVSLDLFAVVFGGATALLPVYARDVLEIGPTGLGLLRAGPAIGAIAMGLWLIARPITDHAGRKMFAAVGAFGLFTIVFAFSQAVWLSVLCLAIIGASDMVSIVIRQSLVQLRTPDELRGRVSAVNQVFIGASNEVGEFRAGTMAAVIGPVAAVALGGIGTLGVVALWTRLFPGLAAVRGIGRE